MIPSLPRASVAFGARQMSIKTILFSIPTDRGGTSTVDVSTLWSRGRPRKLEHIYSLLYQGFLVPKIERAIGRSAPCAVVSSLSFALNSWLTLLGVHPCLPAKEVLEESSTIV